MILRCHRLMLCAFSTHFENALACTEKSAIVTVDIDPQITGVSRYDKFVTKIVLFFDLNTVNIHVLVTTETLKILLLLMIFNFVE